MNRQELEASWARTRQHLAAAFALLGSNPREGADFPTIAEMQDFLDHNELALALDSLEAIGDLNQATPAFWSSLLAAAQEMELEKHVSRYRERALTR